MAVRIPKIMGHIWIGPKPAPEQWMRTWPEKHPKWDYRVYDNRFLREFPFRTRRLINEYLWRGEYAGVQDLMRYEILYQFGGFMADADAVCLHPVDELLTRKRAYTVYDRAQEEGRGVSPFLASDPGNPLLGEVIERLSKLDPWDLRKPFHSTGNQFLMSVIREWGDEKLTIFPSHYFIPWHHSDPENVYRGPDKIYAEQKWGTATYSYNTQQVAGENVLTRQELAERAATLRQQMRAVVQPDLGAIDAEAQGPDPARLSADAHQMAWQGVVSKDGWARQIKALNTALVRSLEAANHAPVFNGNGFYRHKQRDPLITSPLMTRTDALRRRVASYLAGTKSVIQVGVDAGHMLLLQKTLAPQARIVAVDACMRMVANSAPVEVYTPAAIAWFGSEFPDEVTFLTGRPARALAGFRRAKRRFRCDLLHFNGVDPNFLKAYGAAIGALAEDGVILIQHPEAEPVRQRLEELQMIGEVAAPVEFHDFGPGRGAMAVLRRRPQAAAQ
ncbi:MAG: hypothetical protein JXJ18_09430 [Rhodobacteraceae bacterium]|nr:hypothetical protein [Paracoccaceae bacterium]